jgi:transcriptional regulator with XRE-family HTH domain
MLEEEKLLLKIGESIKALRIKKGYSSYESFAFDNELPRMQYWRLEKGKTNPTMRTLRKVLLIHDISFAEFFSEIKA